MHDCTCTLYIATEILGLQNFAILAGTKICKIYICYSVSTVTFCFPFFSVKSASVHSCMACWPCSHHGKCSHIPCTCSPGSLGRSGTYRRHTPCVGWASAQRTRNGEDGWAAPTELLAFPVHACVCVSVENNIYDCVYVYVCDLHFIRLSYWLALCNYTFVHSKTTCKHTVHLNFFNRLAD